MRARVHRGGAAPAGRRFGRHQVAELPPISVICDRASHASVALSALSRADQRPVAGAIAASRVRAAVAGGGRDVDRPASDLAPRDLRARPRSVRRHALDRRVDAICQRASEALAGPHLQLQDWVLDQGAVHVDETGWRTSGEGRALWTATTPGAAFFQIAEHCNREQFDALIGTSYPGIVVSDRWNGYSHLDPTPPPSVLVAPAARLPPPRRRAGRAEDLRRARPRAHRPRVRRLARLPARAPRPRPAPGRDRADPDRTTAAARRRQPEEQAHPLAPPVRQQPAQGLARALDLHHRSTASSRPTTPPNARSAAPVIHRKVSLGTQSDNGERFAERALSAAATCRMQRRSLFTYLSELIAAHNRGDPFPALT